MSFTMNLSYPLTEEQFDTITDADLERTNRIWFHTKHGKEVFFVKENQDNKGAEPMRPEDSIALEVIDRRIKAIRMATREYIPQRERIKLDALEEIRAVIAAEIQRRKETDE